MTETPTDRSSVTVSLAAIWEWLWVYLRSCGVSSPARPEQSGRDFPPARNRAQRHIHRHFSNNTESLPPVRDFAPFRRFGARGVTPTQFMERRCRLSSMGRIEVYRIPYWTPRLCREAFLAIFAAGPLRAPKGLWHVHILPD